MPYLHDDYVYQQVTVMVGFWQWIKCKAEFTVCSIFLQIDECPLWVADSIGICRNSILLLVISSQIK